MGAVCGKRLTFLYTILVFMNMSNITFKVARSDSCVF